MSSLLLNTPPRSSRSTDGSFSLPSTPPATFSRARTTDTRVEELVKRLEETCERLCGDEGISVMKNDPTSAVYVPRRVKEIVHECLSPLLTAGEKQRVSRERDGGRVKGGRREVVRYVEMVRDGGGRKERGDTELERTRQCLAVAQQQHEELSQKYIAVSEKVEEIFRLKAEVSSLTFQRASLRKDNSELQQTLLDQETSFSYALRNSQTERMEREQMIGRLEEQLKQCQTKCAEYELELSVNQTQSQQRSNQMTSEIMRLQQDIRLRREEIDRTERGGREELERVKEETTKQIEIIKKEGEDKVKKLVEDKNEEIESIKRERDEDLVRVKKEMEKLLKKNHQELKETVQRAESEEEKVAELSLINQHLQQQLGESQVTSERLSEDIHRLSVSVTESQTRLREVERDHKERVSELEEQLKQCQTKCAEYELELSVNQTQSQQRSNQMTSEIMRLQQDIRLRREEIERVERGGREELERVREETTKKIEIVKKEGEDKVKKLVEDKNEEIESIKREREEDLVKVKKEMEKILKKDRQELKEVVQRAESEEEKVAELSLINQHLQQQLGESQVTSERLSEDIHRLSVSVTESQTRLREVERDHKEREAEIVADVKRLHNELEDTLKNLEVVEIEKKEVGKTLGAVVNEKERLENELKRLREEMTQRKKEVNLSKQDYEKELKRLKMDNNHHLQQVSQLTSNLEKMRGSIEDEQSEKEHLLKEKSFLTDSLTQYQSTLADVNRQRSLLNTTVATMAEENANIVRERTLLEVKVATLKDTLTSLSKQTESVKAEKQKLEKRVKECEKVVFLAELNRSLTSRDITSPRGSSSLKQTLSTVLSPPTSCHGNDLIDTLLKEYEPLCETFTQMKRRDAQLEEELKTCRVDYETKLQSLQESSTSDYENLKKKHEQTHKEWRNETETLRESLREQQQQLQSQLRDIQADVLRKTETEHEQWERDMTSLRKQLSLEKQKVVEANDELKKQLTSCQNQLIKTQSDSHTLQEDNTLLLKTKEELTMTVTRLEDEKQNLEKSLESSTQQLGDYQMKMSKLESEIERFNKNLEEELKTCRVDYETKFQSLKESSTSDYENLKKKHEQTHKEWRNETETLRESLREQQQQLQSQLRDIQADVLRKTETEHASQLEQWECDMTALRKQLSLEKQQVVEALKKQLTSCQNQLIKTQSDSHTLQEDCTLLLKTKEELTMTVTRLEDEKQNLEKSLESSTQQLGDYQMKMSKLESEIERFNKNHLQMEEKARRDDNLLVETQTQLVKSRERTEELVKEKESVNLELLTAQDEHASQEGELLAIKIDLSSVTEQLEASQLDHKTTEKRYATLLTGVEQILETKNPLHHTVAVDSKIAGVVLRKSPQDVCQAVLKLKNERDRLMESAAKNAELLKQFETNLEFVTRGKREIESHAKILQSSLKSLEARHEIVLKQLDSSNQAVTDNIAELEREKQEFILANETLHKQIKLLKKDNDQLQKKCVELEMRLKEAESTSEHHMGEVLQLKNMVTMLKSSQLNRERTVSELEERLQTTQRDMLQREVAHKTSERTILVLERKLAEFEQEGIKHESAKRELQSRVQYLKSQLKEIHEKAMILRRDLSHSLTEKEALTKDVERLSECLHTTTLEKQMLSHSFEREIERLRAEVENKLHENSSLKLELVHNNTT